MKIYLALSNDERSAEPAPYNVGIARRYLNGNGFAELIRQSLMDLCPACELPDSTNSPLFLMMRSGQAINGMIISVRLLESKKVKVPRIAIRGTSEFAGLAPVLSKNCKYFEKKHPTTMPYLLIEIEGGAIVDLLNNGKLSLLVKGIATAVKLEDYELNTTATKSQDS